MAGLHQAPSVMHESAVPLPAPPGFLDLPERPDQTGAKAA